MNRVSGPSIRQVQQNELYDFYKQVSHLKNSYRKVVPKVQDYPDSAYTPGAEQCFGILTQSNLGLHLIRHLILLEVIITVQ